MTEIFVEDDIFLSHGADEEAHATTIDERIAEVNEAMTKAIRQPVRCTNIRLIDQYFNCMILNTIASFTQFLLGCKNQSDPLVSWSVTSHC